MVLEAQRKAPVRADSFFVADMRQLPPLGEFDLVLCVDDAVNYLLSEADLDATFAGVATALSATGMLIFDVNSLATYRSAFTQTMVRERDGVYFTWRGEQTTPRGGGEIAAATIEIFADRGDGWWERRTSHHIQRHHPPGTVVAALERAGLECRAVVAQLPGAQFTDHVDENRHSKLVYFATRAGNRSQPGR